MAHTLITRWQRLFEQAPTGYRPGVTLAHLRRNLGLADCELLEAGRARFALADASLCFEVHERAESQWLMHLVLCEFQVQRPALAQGSATLELQHTGVLRRTGLRWRLRHGDPALRVQLQQRLAQDLAVQQALMPLDFKRLALACRDGQWQLTLEHMGGSEVVNRMPAFRRYISISPQQRAHLMASLAHFNALLPCL